MVPPRTRLRVLLPVLAVGAACATGPTERPPQPPSPQTVQQELGQRDVLLAGTEFARQQGYTVTGTTEVAELRPNYWRIRFGLAPEGSGKLLQLEFDEVTRSVVRSQEVEVVPSAPLPGRSPTQ